MSNLSQFIFLGMKIIQRTILGLIPLLLTISLVFTPPWGPLAVYAAEDKNTENIQSNRVDLLLNSDHEFVSWFVDGLAQVPLTEEGNLSLASEGEKESPGRLFFKEVYSSIVKDKDKKTGKFKGLNFAMLEGFLFHHFSEGNGTIVVGSLLEDLDRLPGLQKGIDDEFLASQVKVDGLMKKSSLFGKTKINTNIYGRKGNSYNLDVNDLDYIFKLLFEVGFSPKKGSLKQLKKKVKGYKKLFSDPKIQGSFFQQFFYNLILSQVGVHARTDKGTKRVYENKFFWFVPFMGGASKNSEIPPVAVNRKKNLTRINDRNFVVKSPFWRLGFPTIDDREPQYSELELVRISPWLRHYALKLGANDMILLFRFLTGASSTEEVKFKKLDREIEDLLCLVAVFKFLIVQEARLTTNKKPVEMEDEDFKMHIDALAGARLGLTKVINELEVLLSLKVGDSIGNSQIHLRAGSPDFYAKRLLDSMMQVSPPGMEDRYFSEMASAIDAALDGTSSYEPAPFSDSEMGRLRMFGGRLAFFLVAAGSLAWLVGGTFYGLAQFASDSPSLNLFSSGVDSGYLSSSQMYQEKMGMYWMGVETSSSVASDFSPGHTKRIVLWVLGVLGGVSVWNGWAVRKEARVMETYNRNMIVQKKNRQFFSRKIKENWSGTLERMKRASLCRGLLSK